MPGVRLTDEDRERVASGLGEGLGYAEIARQLGRPTSTVSREVARNGGPHGYRADHAQRATEWRARRGKPSPAAESPAGAASSLRR
jgi:IS30 family transposase